MTTRRSFIKKISALLGAGVGIAASPIPSSAAAPATQVTKLIELQESYIAGFQYYEGSEILGAIVEYYENDIIPEILGVKDYQTFIDELELVREPDNPHDERAVSIRWRDRKLGYIPRYENTTISHLLDHGHSLSLNITSVRLEDEKVCDCRVSVWLLEKNKE